jgi:DNA-binding NarL/FixJ family response regulator
MDFPDKILIVDDEPHVRAFLSKIAEAHLGAPKVLESADGERAIELFQQEQPGLVLLDVNLIGLSGLEVLERIRALDEDAVVIMLSTVNVISVIREVVDRGANGYILKNAGSEKVTESLLAAVAESFGEEADADE